MSWRERATPVQEKGGWRSRAKAPEADGEQPAEADSLDFLKPDRPIGAVVAGVNQGATLGFGDEISGAAGVGAETFRRAGQGAGLVPQDVVDADPSRNPNGPEIKKSWGPSQPAGTAPVVPETADRVRPSLADVYRGIRDADRTRQKESERAQPLAHGTGELLGAVALPMPGSGLMKGAPLAAKMGLGAAQAAGMGAVIGVGKSEKEDLEGMRNDGLVNGMLSAPVGAAGGLVGHGMEKLANRFGGAAQAATDKAQGIVEKEALKVYRKAIGSLGGEVSAGRNADEVMHEILASASSTAEQKAAAQSLVNDPERLKMVQRVYGNAIRGFPGRLDSMAKAEAGVVEAAEKNTPEAIAAARDEMLADPVKKRILPSLAGRAKRHLVPAMGTAIGLGAAHLAGVDPVYGLAAGQLFGQTSKQLLAHPAVQKMAFSALESGTSGLSRALQNAGIFVAAQLSPEEKIQLLEKAAETSTDVAAALKESLDQNQSKKPDLRQRFGG